MPVAATSRACERRRAVEVARGRRPAELLAELAQLREQLLAGQRSAAGRGRRRAWRRSSVPKCSITVCGCTRASGSARELPHRRRPPQPLGGCAQLREDLLVGVAACGCPRGTRRARPRRCAPRRAWVSARRAISCKELRAFYAICKLSRAAAPLPAAATLAARWAPGSPSRRSARACGRRGSRARAGRGGGTTLPGQARSGSSIPARSTRSRPGCRAGVALVSATNGKTTTTAMAAEILGADAPARLEPRRARTSLSGVASALARRAATPSSACSRSTRARCRRRSRRTRPRVVALGNLFRDQLDRYGELEHRRRALARRRRRAPRRRRRSSSTPTTRSSPTSPTGASGAFASASTTRGTPAPRLQHAADSKYCVRCGTPYELRGRVRRPSRRLPLPALRPRAARSSTSSRGRSSCAGSTASRFRLVDARGRRARSSSRCPASTTSTTRSPPRRSPRARRVARGVARGSRALQRRVRPLRADPGRRQVGRPPPDQEPGRRERGVRTLETGVPPVLVDRAERRDRRRPGRLVDLGRRLRAAARPRRAGRSSRGDRAAELGLRMRVRRARRRSGSRSIPSLEQALDRGLALVEAGNRARRPPDLHRDAGAARGSSPSAALVRPYWEERVA